MGHILTGRLRGHTAGRPEPLAEATIRVYRLPGGAAPEPPDSIPRFAALSHEEVRAKEPLRVAQAWTDERGEFRVDLAERSLERPARAGPDYAGEPIQIDVYCRSVPGQRREDLGREVQFTVATLRPDWRRVGEGLAAHCERDLPAEFWTGVRTALDAWVVSGRVSSRRERTPLAGVMVYAFDADLIRDDLLGSATTDADGGFRIDFPGAAFRGRAVGGVDPEGGGPDLYFRVEAPDGRILLADRRSRAGDPDRRDVDNGFSADLYVDV
jgi:hypothetical protein